MRMGRPKDQDKLADDLTRWSSVWAEIFQRRVHRHRVKTGKFGAPQFGAQSGHPARTGLSTGLWVAIEIFPVPCGFATKFFGFTWVATKMFPISCRLQLSFSSFTLVAIDIFSSCVCVATKFFQITYEVAAESFLAFFIPKDVSTKLCFFSSTLYVR
jgi:hypothetical protein